MTSPAGNYPALQSAGVAVIPDAHQTLINAGIRERERGIVPGGGPYPEWPNQGTILITNPVSQANYQHYLVLPWVPGMQFDFTDIRFAQQNGTICPYWIETYSSKSSATVWIKIPTANQRQIYLYYGNSRAVSESDGDAVFDFFDDFTGSSVDTGKWTSSGTPTVASSQLTINADNEYVKSISTFATNMILMVSADLGETNHALIELGGGVNQDSAPIINFQYGYPAASQYNIRSYVTGPASSTIGAQAGTKVWEIKRNGTTSIIFDIDDSNVGTLSTQIPTGSLNIYLGNAVTGSNPTSVYNWVAMRKFAATEPTLALKRYGPRPDSSLIYYPFLSVRPGSAGGNHYVMDPIEFGCTYDMTTPTVNLIPADITFGCTYEPHTPTVHKTLAPITFTATYLMKLFAKVFLDLDRVDLDQDGVAIERGIQDSLWLFSAPIDAFHDLDLTVMRHLTFTTTDHLGVSRTLFTGMLLTSLPELAPAAERTEIKGYDYAWYLTQQPVPDAYLHNTATTNPATVITGMLGGNDWMNSSGIEPYRINSVTEWGDTLATKVFDFSRNIMSSTAIQKYCDYTRYVFWVKWRLIGIFLYPCAYYCHEDDIDDPDLGLDLPDPVTFAAGNGYVLDDAIKIQNKNEEKYNRVVVIGRNPAGGSYFGIAQTADVTNGDELPVVKTEISGAFTTQAQVDARAAELLAFYSSPSKTYRCKLADRVDLELLQKVKFTGYTGIPEVWMRITWIKFEVGAAKKIVEIEFTPDAKLSSIRRMYRCMAPDDVGETEAIFDAKMANVEENERGRIIAISDDGYTATVQYEDGRTATVRI